MINKFFADTNLSDKPLNRYFENLKMGFPERAEFLEHCWTVWQHLSGYFLLSEGLVLKIPDACIGDTEGFMYTWRLEGRENLYLECEILQDKSVEFFYRGAPELDYMEWTLGEDLPANAVDYLRKFCISNWIQWNKVNKL